MIKYLNSLDTQLFLFLNSKHNSFFDPLMYWFSDKWIWVPMYLLIAFFIVKYYRIKGMIMILMLGATIAICDQTSSHLLKNIVLRLRPSHEPSLSGLVHLSKAGAGGLYGFVSSHAANAFGFTTFLFFTLDKRFIRLKYWLLFWTITVSYSRIYNGVHYPGDVIVAAIIGILTGWGMSELFLYMESKQIIKTV